MDPQHGDALAKALGQLAEQIKQLGTGDAIPEMGAIEFLGTSIRKAGEDVRDGLSDLADAIRATRQHHPQNKISPMVYPWFIDVRAVAIANTHART